MDSDDSEDEERETVFDKMASAIWDEDREWASVLRDRPDLVAIVAGFRSWAEAAVESAKSLRPTPAVGSLFLGSSRSLPVLPKDRAAIATSSFIAPFRQLALAKVGVGMIEDADARLLELLALLVDVPLRPPAEHYLNRVASLYLWGFDAETFPLARSVLDAALQSRISDETVRRQVKIKAKWVTLKDRIEAAYLQHILDERTANLADDLREAGNDILHRAPKPGSTVETPLDAIKMLAEVLLHMQNGTAHP